MRRWDAAVIDTNIIFVLAGLRALDKLRKLFGSVHVPVAVRREAKLGGRRRRRRDVQRFRDESVPCSALDRMVFASALVAFRTSSPRLSHRGEAQIVAQAIASGIGVVLTDDKDASLYAQDLGLTVLSSFDLARELALLSEEG